MIVAFVMICFAVLALIGYPLLQKPSSKEKDRSDVSIDHDDPVRRKEASYAAIKEIEFDYLMGKLSEEDYRELYQAYKAEAIQAIQVERESKPQQSLMEKLEKEILNRRRKRTNRRAKGASERRAPAGTGCPKCGALNTTDAKFCSQCGLGLESSCPRCGRPIKAKMRYCSDCGSELRAKEGKSK